MKRLLRRLILWALADQIANWEGRIKDMERHFVVERTDKGEIAKTLADVPLEERKVKKMRPRGMSWPQLQQYLEDTEGGRLTHGRRK